MWWQVTLSLTTTFDFMQRKQVLQGQIITFTNILLPFLMSFTFETATGASELVAPIICDSEVIRWHIWEKHYPIMYISPKQKILLLIWICITVYDTHQVFEVSHKLVQQPTTPPSLTCTNKWFVRIMATISRNQSVLMNNSIFRSVKVGGCTSVGSFWKQTCWCVRLHACRWEKRRRSLSH